MSRHIVEFDSIPSNPTEYTYDGTTWSPIEGLESEVGMFNLRLERNRLLAETDWWANSDLTMTAEQTAYRQALRDITDTYTSLDDVVWPEKP